jgi:hypothetical protein
MHMPTCNGLPLCIGALGRSEGVEKPVVFGMLEKPSMMVDYPRRQQQALSLIT